MTDLSKQDVERLAAKFHEIYQAEARRQGDVRHAERYEDLLENVKEFDRVLARYVLAELSTLKQRIAAAEAELKHGHPNLALSILSGDNDRTTA